MVEGELNNYTIYYEDGFYDIKAAYFQVEENSKLVVFRDNAGKWIGAVPIDKFELIVNSEFEIVKDD